MFETEPATEEVIKILKNQVIHSSNTDCLISAKKIRKQLKYIFWSWSPKEIANNLNISAAILIEKKVLSVFSMEIFRQRNKEIFMIHAEALANV